ncbi:hypothetical protein WMF39_37610 [Sorangium sp. So ce1504]|uniref:hypothetical protein n=1 Tax=Sorangium sp. So ce1504 TaxID=3133337 RepID=UPI003F5FCE39
MAYDQSANQGNSAGRVLSLIQEFVASQDAAPPSEDAIAFREWLGNIATRINDWVEKNRPALQRLGQDLSRVLEKLPDWEANLQTNMLLVERGLEVLYREGYGSTGYILSMQDARDLGVLSAEELDECLYAQTSTPEFAQAVLDLYRSSGLQPQRASLISEGIALHREGRFAGAIPLLISQLEGIVTDALDALPHPSSVTEKPVSPNPRQLPGLYAKAQAADRKAAGTTEIFSDLLRAVLTPSDPNSTISKTRNGILHGSDVSFATQRRSTQVLLWMIAILTELRSVLPLRNDDAP